MTMAAYINIFKHVYILHKPGTRSSGLTLWRLRWQSTDSEGSILGIQCLSSCCGFLLVCTTCTTMLHPEGWQTLMQSAIEKMILLKWEPLTRNLFLSKRLKKYDILKLSWKFVEDMILEYLLREHFKTPKRFCLKNWREEIIN